MQRPDPAGGAGLKGFTSQRYTDSMYLLANRPLLKQWLRAAALVAAMSCLLVHPVFAQRADADPPGLSPQQAAQNKQNQGQIAATGWLQLLDVGDWGGSWERASPKFRSLVPLDKWMDGVPQLRKPFGRFVSRTLVESNHRTAMPGLPPGQYVSTRFSTQFSNQPNVTEVVTAVLDTDGRWRVVGYYAK